VKGIFELTSAPDLLKKLRYEFDLLKREPRNSYVAFNFFVTAEHLPDWLYPGKTNREKRTQVRKTSVLLQICSHIANGAKHFEVEDKHHQSVSDTRRTGGMFSAGMFKPQAFAGQVFSKGGLFVHLKGNAEQQFGERISVLELAERVHDFWDKDPDLKAARKTR
jgi:hypothetical protein